jgi:tetratricopeptide (TPR) repeat protein
MKKILCVVGIGSLLLIGSSAFAKGKPAKETKTAPSEREAREREARKACLEGDFAKGVAILSDLFLDSKDATYIFNQGRCYEQAERYQEAIRRFREYLRTPGSGDPSLAQRHITECEELEAKKNPPLAAPPVAQPVALPPVTKAQPEDRHFVVTQPQPTSSSGSGLRTAGVVTAGIGAAGAIAGVVLNLKANKLAKSIEPPNTYDRSTESSRKNYETFSWVSYGAGVAGLVTGAILYGIGLGNGSDSAALLPMGGPSVAGATLSGAF